jgi:hypothetical protein
MPLSAIAPYQRNCAVELSDDFILEVRHRNESIKLTAEEIMGALLPVRNLQNVGRQTSRSMSFDDFVPNGGSVPPKEIDNVLGR